MRDTIAPNPNAGARRRIQRLSRVVSDLAAGATTVEELGSRLTAPTDVPAIANAVRPAPAKVLHHPADPIAHANVSAVGWHGGILPAP